MNNNLGFTRGLYSLIALLFILASCSKPVEEAPYTEGVHYEVFSGEASPQPQLTEFFWYGCSHCKSFAPLLSAWAAQHPEVSVGYQPIIWGEKSELHARLFYLLKQQSNFDALHKQMFDEVMGFAQTDTVADHQVTLIRSLSEAGISALDSATALTDARFDDAIAATLIQQQQYGVSATPTVIVNQKYKVLNKELGSLEDILNVAEWLLSQ